MAYGDPTAKPYTAGGTPTDTLATRDLGRAAVGGLPPQVQEVTHEVTGCTTLRKTVTAAGTRVRLNATALPVRKATIQALPSNVGAIVVGDNAVVAAAATSQGQRLYANDSYSFEFNDLTNIWIDAEYSGEGVSVIYFT